MILHDCLSWFEMLHVSHVPISIHKLVVKDGCNNEEDGNGIHRESRVSQKGTSEVTTYFDFFVYSVSQTRCIFTSISITRTNLIGKGWILYDQVWISSPSFIQLYSYVELLILMKKENHPRLNRFMKKRFICVSKRWAFISPSPTSDKSSLKVKMTGDRGMQEKLTELAKRGLEK